MTADPSISTFRTALVPCASGSVFGDEPGWVYPSTVTGSAAFGSQVVEHDRVDAGPRDVEVDGVGAGSRVRVEDRLAQRAGARVGRGRHREGRGRTATRRQEQQRELPAASSGT